MTGQRRCAIGQVALPCTPIDTTPVQRVKSDRDSLWNGRLIGAGIGAAVGMLIAPQAMCGGNDTECAAIVRVAVGLPSIAVVLVRERWWMA
jgi:hypothetical protein